MTEAMAEGRTFSENGLEDIFDFITASARHRKRALQKLRRVPVGDRKSRGTSPFLEDKYVSSVMTDGVSMCVRTKEPRQLPTIRGRVTRGDPKPHTPENVRFKKNTCIRLYFIDFCTKPYCRF